MSILDAFYILFKSQGTEQVKKDEESLNKSGDNLNKSLKETSSLSNKAGESFLNLGRQLAGTLTAAVSLGSVLSGIKSSLDYAVNLDQVSQSLAVNVEELDAWDNAVKRIGGTAEGFQSSLKNLASRLGTTGETALRVLPQLADSFQQMGRFAAIRYGESLGLDEKTILLLQKGRREVESVIKQQKELGVVSKKDAEAARQFNYAWQDATHSLRSAFMGVAMELLPLITKAVEAFGIAAQYFRKHSDLIVGGLIAIGLASVAAFPELYAGIAIVGALTAAFALLYEDIKYFIQGQDSLIGRILKKWPQVGAAVRATVDEFERFFNILDRLYSKYYKFMSGGKDFRIYGKEGDQGIDDRATNTPDSYKKRLIDSFKMIGKAQEVMRFADTSPLSSQVSNRIFNNSSRSANRNMTISTGPITINTQATDPNGVAQAFGFGLFEQIQQANNYFDDGVQV